MHIFDLALSLIFVFFAFVFLINNALKISKNKHQTLCNGCSSVNCKTKDFGSNIKAIKIHRI